LEIPRKINNICDLAEDVIRKMLVVDPKTRATMNEIMNHPWVKGEGVSKLHFRPSFRDLMISYNNNRKQKTPPTSPSGSFDSKMRY